MDLLSDWPKLIKISLASHRSTLLLNQKIARQIYVDKNEGGKDLTFLRSLNRRLKSLKSFLPIG